MGWTYLYAGDYRAALDACDQALALDPEALHARQCALHASAGIGDETRSASEAARLLGRGTARDLTLAAFHRQAVARLGHHASDRVERALMLAALGDTEQALTALESALADRLPQLVLRIRDPRLQPLTSTTRFRAIVERMRLAGISGRAP